MAVLIEVPLRVGRAFARLFTASRGPSVGREENIARDRRSAFAWTARVECGVPSLLSLLGWEGLVAYMEGKNWDLGGFVNPLGMVGRLNTTSWQLLQHWK
jgi:hypothetical protein